LRKERKRKREKTERRCSEGVRVRAVESRRRGGQLSAFPHKITSRIASESSVDLLESVRAYPVRDEGRNSRVKGKEGGTGEREGKRRT
jgi:hypothetical protein